MKKAKTLIYTRAGAFESPMAYRDVMAHLRPEYPTASNPTVSNLPQGELTVYLNFQGTEDVYECNIQINERISVVDIENRKRLESPEVKKKSPKKKKND